MISYYSRIFLFSIFFFSCKKKENLDTLIGKDFLYFARGDTVHPFSGKAYKKVTNRGTEYILASYSFKEGIPNGKWKVWGYSNEVLQSGNFTPILNIGELKNDFPNLKRINIDRYTEGTDDKMIDLFLISTNPSRDSINYQLKKKKYLNT
jgi:hypothetical protein